eukprot:Nk52_evm9s805 gene=Nk52_evmTU9s805
MKQGASSSPSRGAKCSDVFSCRIITIEPYLCVPHPTLDLTHSPITGNAIRKVPVMRIFGCTPGGQKVCMHVHRTLPYFYVAYNEGEHLSENESLDFAAQLANSLNLAVNVSFGLPENVEHIFNVVIVKGVPFYGYHDSVKLFLKIFYYDPTFLKHMLEVLRGAAVMGRSFEPYEAHIPYPLQFMIDHNLYGMDFVHCETSLFRGMLPVGNSPCADSGDAKLNAASHTPESSKDFRTFFYKAPRLWTSSNVDENLRSPLYHKTSSCTLEVDVDANNILNISEIDPASYRIRSGLETPTSELNLVRSLAAAWDDEKSRRELYGEIPIQTTEPVEIRSGREVMEHEKQMWRTFNLFFGTTDSTQSEESKSEEWKKFISNCSQSNNLPVHQAPASKDTKNVGTSYHSQTPRLDREILSQIIVPSPGVSAYKGTTSDLENVGNDEVDIDSQRGRVLSSGDAPIMSQDVEGDTDFEDETWITDDDLNRYMTEFESNNEDGVQRVGNHQQASSEVDNDKRKGKDNNFTIPQCDGGVDSNSDDDVLLIEPIRTDYTNSTGFQQNLEEQKNEEMCRQNESSEQTIENWKPSFRTFQSLCTSENEFAQCQLDLWSPSGSPILSASSPPRATTPSEIALDPLSSFHPQSEGGDSGRAEQGSCKRERSCEQDCACALETMDHEGRCSENHSFVDQSGNTLVRESIWLEHAPSASSLSAALDRERVFEYDMPYFNVVSDVPQAPLYFEGKEIKIKSKSHARIPSWKEGFQIDKDAKAIKDLFDISGPFTKGGCKRPISLAPLDFPPSRKIKAWSFNESQKKRKKQQKTKLEHIEAMLKRQRISNEKSDDDLFKTPLMVSKRSLKTIDSRKRLLQNESGRGSSSLNSQISITPLNKYGYKCATPQKLEVCDSPHSVQHLDVLSIEVFCSNARDGKKPNPEHDPVSLISYVLERESVPGETDKGILVLDSIEESAHRFQRYGLLHMDYFEIFSEEYEMLNSFSKKVRKLDPDILVGYEVNQSSIGYIIERCKTLKYNIVEQMSRLPFRQNLSKTKGPSIDREKDAYAYNHSNYIHITGRIVINVWRTMRKETSLNIYTFENVAFHVLHRRFPLFNHSTLQRWWNSRYCSERFKVIDYTSKRTAVNIDLLKAFNLIIRTSEQARLYGIDFSSVLSRGSQFRVESMMLRLVKPMNFLALSPSRKQVNEMNIPEALPLILEPENVFYANPVIVLDFQSLYPSIVIAYNMCYSTCLGKLSEDEVLKLGTTLYENRKEFLASHSKDIFIAPNSALFASPNVRAGVLPTMLSEILKTRIMVKKSMKLHKKRGNSSLDKMLDARQFGLKMIANVTYGYTSANFSGRMPCIEIADAIVSTGKQTLERAINLVNETKKWNSRVVYGDTDSLFVEVIGASRQEAFRVGREIVQKVNEVNPKPVTLKFEKVFHPCILMKKKRYVGYMYETEEQVEGVVDAKGIETIRRDTCPVVSKMLGKCIHMLFRKCDLSKIKSYVQKQFRKIDEEKIPIIDFIFAREVKPGKYKKPALQPAAVISAKMMAEDSKNEPQYKQRIPFVVVCGEPHSRVIDNVRRPEELLFDFEYNSKGGRVTVDGAFGPRIDSRYYIEERIVPALNRVFNTMGVDVKSWYAEMPRTHGSGTSFKRLKSSLIPVKMREKRSRGKAAVKINRIDQYFSKTNCVICGQEIQTSYSGNISEMLCRCCLENKAISIASLQTKIMDSERNAKIFHDMCESCIGFREDNIECVSLDCPILYSRIQSKRELIASTYFREIVDFLS